MKGYVYFVLKKSYLIQHVFFYISVHFTKRHDVTEILLKMALNTITNPNHNPGSSRSTDKTNKVKVEKSHKIFHGKKRKRDNA